MKAYLTTTAAIFGLIVVAHALRAVAEGPRVAQDPFFLVMTALAAAMCVWAVRLLRRPGGASPAPRDPRS